MTALSAALEALEEIAARGIVRHVGERKIDGKTLKDYRCPECDDSQSLHGLCLNRDCLTSIARRGIDEARRAL